MSKGKSWITWKKFRIIRLGYIISIFFPGVENSSTVFADILSRNSLTKLAFSFGQKWIAPFWFFKRPSDDSLVQAVKKCVLWQILYRVSICFSAWNNAQSQPELLLVFKERKLFLRGSNGIRAHNYLVRKQTFNHLAKLSNLVPRAILENSTGTAWFRGKFLLDFYLIFTSSIVKQSKSIYAMPRIFIMANLSDKYYTE